MTRKEKDEFYQLVVAWNATKNFTTFKRMLNDGFLTKLNFFNFWWRCYRITRNTITGRYAEIEQKEKAKKTKHEIEKIREKYSSIQYNNKAVYTVVKKEEKQNRD